MKVEVKTPALPESVADALIIGWYKKVGESVERDEPLVELETDKVVLEVPSPVSGVLESITEDVDATVVSEQLLGIINEGGEEGSQVGGKEADKQGDKEETSASEIDADSSASIATESYASPSVRKALRENELQAEDVGGSGKKGRILKDDVLDAAQSRTQQSAEASHQSSEAKQSVAESLTDKEPSTDNMSLNSDGRIDERVPMTRLRKRIAERLHEATQSTAMLTTFNEVNMQPLMDMRKEFKDLFEKTHQARLGFMSLFVKASTLALQRFPEVNASIDGDDIIYHGYCDIGIAVSSPRGLVVPILRNTQDMSMANVESSIAAFASKAKEGKLAMDELTGGTFTITNGGVFGSLFSTPILNPPQSAILAMHGINKRVVVENDEMVIRPMMYLALSYDHQIIDGQSAVLFLRTIKELVENPQRILLEV